MTAGIYEAEIIITSDDPCNHTKIIPATMTVNPDDLAVSPIEDFKSFGRKGGPFTPDCMSYTLTNDGCSPVNHPGVPELFVILRWKHLRSGDLTEKWAVP